MKCGWGCRHAIDFFSSFLSAFFLEIDIPSFIVAMSKHSLTSALAMALALNRVLYVPAHTYTRTHAHIL